MAVNPDLILLDLGLPDMDGVEVIARIRQWSQVPIIVLSVRDRETDKVRALDTLADDYLTKPFGVGELLARIRATLRRALPPSPEPVYRIDDLEVDLASRLVRLHGAEVSLTPTEYDVLRLLVSNAGKVLTHRQILKQLWGATYLEQPHILRVNISNLRHKLETDPSTPRYIVTETGVRGRKAITRLDILSLMCDNILCDTKLKPRIFLINGSPESGMSQLGRGSFSDSITSDLATLAIIKASGIICLSCVSFSVPVIVCNTPSREPR